jgi:hypothetical protein
MGRQRRGRVPRLVATGVQKSLILIDLSLLPRLSTFVDD